MTKAATAGKEATHYENVQLAIWAVLSLGP